MKPVNLDNSPCTPQSSNCIIWQGPDIPCIKLCTGDTITDVVYSLATELCTILDQLDVKNYDLTCFGITNCGPNDFNALVQFLIDQICALQGVSPTTEKSASGCPDCIVSTASCFTEKGYPASMQLVEYVNAIATEVCNIINRLAEIDSAITQLQTDVQYIKDNYCQDCNAYTTPEFTLACQIGTLASGSTNPIDTILSNFINGVWCSFVNTTGNAGSIASAVASQCISQYDTTKSDPGQQYGDLSGWVDSPVTLADSIYNIWLVLCDLYNSSVTVTGEDTPTIRTTVTGGPDYVVSAKINDTGWKQLNGFTFLSGFPLNARPRVRRIGNVLHFAGTAVVPMGDADDGASGTIQTENSTLSAYYSLKYGMTLNSVLAPLESEACQIYVGTSGNQTPWSNPPASQYGLSLYFNSGNGVLPSGILGTGESIEANTYRLAGNWNILTRPVEISSISGSRTALMSTVVRIQLIPTTDNLKLSMVSITSNEAYHPDDGIVYASGLRSMISRAVTGERVPYIDGTQPGFQTGGSLTGVYNIEGDSTNGHSDGFGTPYGGDATWGHDQDAGDALQLGGFIFSLDGLTAFVDPCGTSIMDYKTCS